MIGRKNHSILVIDDDPDIRNIVKNSLSEVFNVILATDGQEGLFKFRNQHFDLIICDLSMPKKNGIELLQSVREHENRHSNRKCPALVISSAMQDYLKELTTIELVYSLEKPFNGLKLEKKIKEIFLEIQADQQTNNIIKLNTNDILIEEGKKETRVFLLTSGKLGAYKKDSEQNEIFLGEIQTYEVVGEMSIFLDNHRHATVRALEDSIVKVIPGHLFIQTLESLPTWFRSTLSTYAKRIVQANNIISSKNSNDSPNSNKD